LLVQAVGPRGYINAVDDSFELISIARELVTAPNVKFILNDEYDMDSLIAGRQDAAFSNAAFWQYDQEEVLSSFHHLLKPGGNLYFNLSGAFFDFKGSGIGSPRYDGWPYLQSDILKRWVTIARERNPYRNEPPDPRPPKRTAAQLEHDCQAGGFSITSIIPVFFEIPRDDELAWLRIPVWTESTMGQIPDHERYGILDEIFATIPADATFVGKWVTVVAERQ
jgi:SAM-dependent methyltransferase